MSGIEVAGIVLAVIPLFISAAEHYQEGLTAGKRAFKMKMFLEQYTRELTAQSALLVCYLKDFIGRTALPADIQRDLVKDPTGNWWVDPEIVEIISDELGDTYQPFMDTLYEICRVLAKQIQDDLEQYLGKLDLSTGATPLKQLVLDKEQFDLRTRLKFSWRSSQRDALLQDFRGCTELLGKLSRAAERTEPYRQKQKLYQARMTYYEWRRDVERLLETICDYCQCKICVTHEVSLRLQRLADGDSESEFDMLLYNSYDTCCEFSVAVERLKSKQSKQGPGKPILPQDALRVTKFAAPLRKALADRDICKELRSAKSTNAKVQLFLNERAELFALQTHPSRASKSKAQRMLTLSDVMTRLKPFGRKKWLQKEKALLAVVVADSLLQLSSTPWSQVCWDSQTLTFEDPGLNHLSHPDYQFKLRRPYTLRHPVSKINSSEPTSIPLRKNDQVHALGILLLELYLNHPLDEAAADELILSPVSPASSDPATALRLRRSLAQDLLQEHADDDEMTPQYYEAVRFCLSPIPNPESRSFSFQDAGFREIFYREVVANLEASLRDKWEVNDRIWREEG